MRDLILRNSEWRRDRGMGATFLLGTDGMRCCLGIDAKARGIPDSVILLEHYPHCTTTNTPEGQDYKNDWPDETAREVARINDNPRLSDEKRVGRLRPYFAARGINIIFDPES